MNYLKNIQSYIASNEDKCGSILYSSIETLKEGNYYILGLNPGGDGGESIKDQFSNLLNKKNNSYLDESWSTKRKKYNIGQHPYQLGVKKLCDTLKIKTEDTFATNLIFVRTQNSNKIENFKCLSSLCWEVHKEFLKIVKPKTIIAIGIGKISPYKFLVNELNPCPIKIEPYHINNKLACYFFNKEYSVIGIPHLSRFSWILNNNDTLDWIINKAKKSGT